MDKHSSILQSFSLQDKLNPEVWNLANESSEIMKPEIRERLLEIAYEFIEFLEITVFVDDIILTGSLSNYNWSKFSDFDLHLIIDFNQFPKDAIELYQKLFNLLTPCLLNGIATAIPSGKFCMPIPNRFVKNSHAI